MWLRSRSLQCFNRSYRGSAGRSYNCRHTELKNGCHSERKDAGAWPGIQRRRQNRGLDGLGLAEESAEVEEVLLAGTALGELDLLPFGDELVRGHWGS